MSKWIIIGVAAVAAVGTGLWLAFDPNARLAAGQVWNGVVATLARARANVNSSGLLQPIAGAFQNFADSVASLWSPEAIRIEVPSIQLPH